jgi:outer membrane lipopolysaccharide assembly protein LptE/RlpB
VPKERVAALRLALTETLKDPEVIAAARKEQMTLAPMSGEVAEQLVAKLLSMPPALVKKAYDSTHTD